MSARTGEAASRRARRQEARAKVAALRERVRELERAKKRRMRELTQVIRGERIALRDRLRANRARVLGELREAARAERSAAREDWNRRRLAARGEGTSEVARARAEFAAERAQQAAERKIERAHRADAAAHARGVRLQSDDEVRALIPRALVPLFDRVKRSIRGGAAQTRAEALLRYAEKHPEETFKAVEPRAEEQVQAARVELDHATRAAGRGETPGSYEAKRAARIERMRAKAARLEAAAAGAHAQARAVGDRIPMGQPILIGHHSQRRHERDLERMDASFRKSMKLAEEAKTLERRAVSAERNRTVFSDDPAAVQKLREKLARLNEGRERMRAANAVIRAGGDVVSALVRLGFRDDQARKLLERDFAGRVGFPDYALRNAASEAARVERRIGELVQRAEAPAPADVVVGEARISEAENRVRIAFPSVPPEPLRRALKGAGFRWAPSVGAWQRHASPGAWYAAKQILAATGAGAP
jgi:hypothetical protein